MYLIARMGPLMLVSFIFLAKNVFGAGYSAQYSADKLREFCSIGLKCKDYPNRCEIHEVAFLSACLAYISGFREGHLMGVADAAAKASKKQEDYSIEELYQRHGWFCLPGEASNAQMAEVFLKYIGEHPERLHRPAFEQLYEAMKTHFPCK